MKKCPICNKSANISEWLIRCEDDTYLKYPVIVCSGCGLTLWGCAHEEDESIGREEIKALVDLWNTRFPSHT